MGLIGQAVAAAVGGLVVTGSGAPPAPPSPAGCAARTVAVDYRTSGTAVEAVGLTGLPPTCVGRTVAVRLRDRAGHTLATTAATTLTPAMLTGRRLTLPVPPVPPVRVVEVTVVVHE